MYHYVFLPLPGHSFLGYPECTYKGYDNKIFNIFSSFTFITKTRKNTFSAKLYKSIRVKELCLDPNSDYNYYVL